MRRTRMLFAAAIIALGLCAWVAAEDIGARNWNFIRGDANIDGIVDIADMVDSLGFLFAVPGHETPHCLAAHDANDDGLVNVADAIYTANYLFGGGPTPPAPFPDCGLDPTEPRDGFLPCDYYYVCATRR